MRCNLSSSANSYPTDMLLETKKWDLLKKAKWPILLLCVRTYSPELALKNLASSEVLMTILIRFI